MFGSFQSMMIHLLVGMDAMRSGWFACDFWWLFAPYSILLFAASCTKKRVGARRAAARSPRAANDRLTQMTEITGAFDSTILSLLARPSSIAG
jgi:hypothetical protein